MSSTDIEDDVDLTDVMDELEDFEDMVSDD